MKLYILLKIYKNDKVKLKDDNAYGNVHNKDPFASLPHNIRH